MMAFVAWFGTIPIYTDPPQGFWNTLALYSVPAAAVGFRSSALVMRLTRSSMLEVLRQDYIRTARAKGASEQNVNYHHAGNGGYVAGAIIGGIATAIIAAEAAKAAARQSAGQPSSRHIGARKKRAPENANASVANNSGDPFAGAVPTRIKRED